MSSVSTGGYKQYFVPGWSISRNIIFSHIHYFLGPDSSVRPYSYQGREGYLVITRGPPLTEVRLSSPRTRDTRPQTYSNSSRNAESDRRPTKSITAVRTASGGADDRESGSARRVHLHQSTSPSPAASQIPTERLSTSPMKD